MAENGAPLSAGAAAPRPGRFAPIALAAALAAAGLAGCESYSPLSLPDAPDLAASLPKVDAARVRAAAPELAPHPLAARGPLDMTDIAILAVLENPELKATRLKRKVARAQAFSAGLLPDPQLIATLDPTTNFQPGVVPLGWAVGLQYDLQSLVVHGAKKDAAQAAAEQVDLETLWQEWQAIQQARTLYVELVEGRRKLDLLRQARTLYARRYRESAAALAHGGVTIETTGPDLTSLLDLESQTMQAERQLEQTRHELDALLGIEPTVRLELAGLSAPQALAPDVVARAMRGIAARRPDLLALRAGYRAQEAMVREAILAQFPSFSIGVQRASDTTDVHTVGISLGIGLPLFNANRGEIAVQRATRAQLRQEYQARLDRTYGAVDQLAENTELLARQIAEIDAAMPELARMVAEAEHAYRHQDIATLSYLNLENSMVQKRIERVDLEQALWSARIGLDTLLGWPEGDSMGGHAAPAAEPRS